MAVDEALGAAGGGAAHHADGLQLGDLFRLGHEQRHGAKGLAPKVHVQPGQDDPQAALGQLAANGRDLPVKELGLVAVDEGRICTEMLDLYQVDGIIAEPAGALASAALLDRIDVQPGQDVVVVLSGGNNDVSRYAEIVERSLVNEGRKHYFLVNFPQEPGALRRFLGEVLGPDDDIAHFEYVKRSNRETGPALVGIELGRPEDIEGLLRRIEDSPMVVERIPPDSSLYRFLV